MIDFLNTMNELNNIVQKDKREVCKGCNKKKRSEDIHSTEGYDGNPEHDRMCDDCIIELSTGQ